jgi:hypothetical protein
MKSCLPLDIYLFLSECTSWFVVPGVSFHGKYTLFVCMQNISCEGMQNSSYMVPCIGASEGRRALAPIFPYKVLNIVFCMSAIIPLVWI